MAQRMHCFDILLSAQLPGTLPRVVFSFGDDAFLRRETTTSLLQLAGLDVENIRSFDGDECAWLDIHDELATLSLFEADALRVAIVTNGDKIVKDWRAQLEKWCSSPAESSLLVVELNSFPANTKLYKIVDKQGWCIGCSWPTSGRGKAPVAGEVKKWIAVWAESRHGLKVSAAQTQLILDAVGPESGLLHQELAKLALYADERGKISDEEIRKYVGSWRSRTTWEIADAIADGRIPEAFLQLERVFSAGEHPAAIIPQISWSLRRFGMAASLILQAQRQGKKLPAQAAIGQCGFWGNDAKLAESRLRRMGLRRAGKLLDWLLELDLKIKGSHSSTPRAIFALEEFCLRLSDAK